MMVNEQPRAGMTPWGSVHSFEDGRMILVRAARDSGLILHIELLQEEVQAILDAALGRASVA